MLPQGVAYGSGFFLGVLKSRILRRSLIHLTGEEYTETLTIGPLRVNDQSIGAAFLAAGFNNVDGILGFVSQDIVVTP